MFTLKGYAENHENRVVVESNVSSIIDLETLEVENSTIVKLYGVSIDYYRKYLQDYKEEELSQTETGLTVGVSKAYFKGESVDHLINRAQEFYESLLLGKRVYLEKNTGRYFLHCIFGSGEETELESIGSQVWHGGGVGKVS